MGWYKFKLDGVKIVTEMKPKWKWATIDQELITKILINMLSAKNQGIIREFQFWISVATKSYSNAFLPELSLDALIMKASSPKTQIHVWEAAILHEGNVCKSFQNKIVIIHLPCDSPHISALWWFPAKNF